MRDRPLQLRPPAARPPTKRDTFARIGSFPSAPFPALPKILIEFEAHADIKASFGVVALAQVAVMESSHVVTDCHSEVVGDQETDFRSDSECEPALRIEENVGAQTNVPTFVDVP